MCRRATLVFVCGGVTRSLLCFFVSSLRLYSQISENESASTGIDSQPKLINNQRVCEDDV